MSSFRSRIIHRDRKCIVTGVSNLECDAAHIIPYNICLQYFESASLDENNGILLTKSLHSLFDQHIWTFDVYQKDRPDGPQEGKNGYINLPVIINPMYKKTKTTIHNYEHKLCRLSAKSYPYLCVHYRVFIDKLNNCYHDKTYENILKGGERDGGKPEPGQIMAICDHKHIREQPHYLVCYTYRPFTQQEWVPEEDVDADFVQSYQERLEKQKDGDYKPR